MTTVWLSRHRFERRDNGRFIRLTFVASLSVLDNYWPWYIRMVSAYEIYISHSLAGIEVVSKEILEFYI